MWGAYYIGVKVIVSGGEVTAIDDVFGDAAGEVDPRYVYSAKENKAYLDKAVNGKGRVKGVKAKIQAKLDAGQPVEGIDAVSGATWSSKSIVEAFEQAVRNAEAAA